jgi:hypothetical protein
VSGHAFSPSRLLAPEAMPVTGARAPWATRWVRPTGPTLGQTGGPDPEARPVDLAPEPDLVRIWPRGWPLGPRARRLMSLVPTLRRSASPMGGPCGLPIGPGPRPAEILRPHWTGVDRLLRNLDPIRSCGAPDFDLIAEVAKALGELGGDGLLVAAAEVLGLLQG